MAKVIIIANLSNDAKEKKDVVYLNAAGIWTNNKKNAFKWDKKYADPVLAILLQCDRRVSTISLYPDEG